MPGRRDDIISIFVKTPNKEDSAKIANAIITAYTDFHLKANKNSASETYKLLQTDKTKIDAAREALLLHLDSLGQATQVTILAFATIAEPIFEGASNDSAAIRAALAAVEPNGETDIAAALRAAKTRLDAHPADLLARILLISDGLSDAAEAAEAAADLQRGRIPIDAILIDTAEAGTDLIRRVVGASGSVTSVTSEPGMKAALESVGVEG